MTASGLGPHAVTTPASAACRRPSSPEQLVVVQIIDGIADQTLVHLPAPQISGFKFTRYDWPPTSWPSACGEVASGSVYVRAGMLADAPVCGSCQEVS